MKILKVIRGGKQVMIKEEELLVGDIMILEEGHFVSVDGLLFKGKSKK